MTKKKILIIEDEEYIASMYELKFKQSDYDVIVSGNGLDGFDKAQQMSPDVILLDLILPEMTGYEILKKLKKDPKTEEIPVIITSNLAQNHEVQHGLDLGAVDYIVKTSITPSELVSRVDSVVKSQ
ncbi:MAG TPA: response regulator transcription factor [Patescibacteria group bacterium]|nr:response regulator transcription factor [Patescibacteria group bacterium]